MRVWFDGDCRCDVRSTLTVGCLGTIDISGNLFYNSAVKPMSIFDPLTSSSKHSMCRV